MKKPLFFVAIAAIVLLVGYRTFASVADTGMPATPRASVKTIEISPTPFQETAVFSGFVRGAKQSAIAPKISGYIMKLNKEEGDTVRQGETVAILDSNELSAAQQSSILSLQSIDKQLKDTEEYYDQKVDEAKSARDNASGSSERDAANETLKSAKHLREAELSSLRTQRAGLEGSALISGANMADAVVRAPFTGIITRKNASLGSFVSPGTSIYTIASPDAFEIVVSLPEAIAAKITKGAAVSVSDDTATLEGSVFSIASAAEETSQRATARIHFLSATALAAFHLGEHVTVSFPLGTSREAILVPEAALFSAYDDTFVYAVKNGIAKRLPVSLGVADGQAREIVSGLSNGMHIITEGADTLSDNQPVDESYVAHE